MQLTKPRTLFFAVRSLLSNLSWWRCCLPVLALTSLNIHYAGAEPIDAGLYTTYFLFSNNTKVSWSVCGQTKSTEGCYGSGQLGPFGKVGALLEGVPTIDSATHTVTRAIYVLDIASGTQQNGVVLSIYQKNDVITGGEDKVTVTLSGTLDLALTGGSTALASMAGNANYLVVGTSRSPFAIEITKSTLATTQFGGFSPPINVHAVTADAYGYITMEFGKFSGTDTAIVTLGPDGALKEDGGGAWFTLNTTQAILPQNLK